MKLKRILLSATCLFTAMFVSASVGIESVGGWFQSGYVTFSLDSSASSYNVYCKSTSGSYEQLDNYLVRNYGTYGRADAMGLAEGTYQFKVVPVDADGNEVTASAVESGTFTVTVHDRTGFAFTGSKTPGAYNADGTLKDNAVVVYVTNDNKDDVTLTVKTGSSSTTTCTGIQAILDGYKKGYENRPLVVRFIGNITPPSVLNDEDYDYKGDMVVDMKSNTQGVCEGITLEGVGNDATINGFGIRLKNCYLVELCNLGFMNVNSTEDDAVGLQQDNDYIWVHNCDFFYGTAGSDEDQVKGDGSLDCKLSNYVTFSYNHFWDTGKCCLLGLEGESDDMYITYHHNWFDHSDSRHPRVRYYSAHVYNNYYDGNAKYGVGATCGSSVFVENNYFRNTSKPMLISMQGTDIASGSGTFNKEDGGIIKAYNNTLTGTYTFVPYSSNNTSFDAYVVTSASDEVPNTVVTKQGGTSYNNFDTNSSLMYTYIADDPSTIPDKLASDLGAGRCQHGDFSWTFTSSDDTSYAVNTELQSALVGYTTSLVGLFDENNSSNSGSDSGDDTGYECWFVNNVPTSSFYTFEKTGSDDVSYGSGSGTYNGKTYINCLKLENATVISFTTDNPMILTIVEEDDKQCKAKVDGTVYSADGSTNNVLEVSLEGGEHKIERPESGDFRIFYLNLTLTSGINGVTLQSTGNEIYYNLNGQRVSTPSKGVYILNGKKILVK